jgi:uroporphyrinogen-III decarboxylase
MLTAIRPELVKEIFEYETDVALRNLARIYEATKDSINALYLCGTDFGTQNGLFSSPQTFDDVYAPYYAKINDWIHERTHWKTFKHSCGAIEPIIDRLIDCGFDILNPVQCSAAGMDPSILKKKYGKRIVFWGGGVNTQATLPFGSPEEVRKEVLERCAIFSPGGGFVFNTIHNVQARTPVDNFIAMVDAVKEFNAR